MGGEEWAGGDNGPLLPLVGNHQSAGGALLRVQHTREGISARSRSFRLCPARSLMTLRPKKMRPIIRNPDWFRPKRLPHFDLPVLDRITAVRLACNPAAVVRHAFLPLIAFTKRHRRFTSRMGEAPVGITKERPLAFCANRDAVVFGYYAHLLRERYEALLGPLGINTCVVGYRSGMSNIGIAHEAFTELAARGRCTVLALDIEGFFDTIPHAVLKVGWIGLLGTGGILPDDHYAVFRALTRFSKVDRDRCLERLGLPKDTPMEELPKPLCSVADFRRLIRGDGTGMPSLIETNTTPFGIPQGTPMSPVAANIAMLKFDTAVAAEVVRAGGSYRRYSDDIFVLCDPADARRLEAFIAAALDAHAPGLRLKDSKTQRVQFHAGSFRAQPPLQYLGFTFDGQQILLRGATLARHWRRLATAVRWAKRRHKLALAGVIPGRSVVHRKALLTRYSHLGTDNFHTGYSKRASRIMSTRAIRRQLRNHLRFMQERLDAP